MDKKTLFLDHLIAIKYKKYYFDKYMWINVLDEYGKSFFAKKYDKIWSVAKKLVLLQIEIGHGEMGEWLKPTVC